MNYHLVFVLLWQDVKLPLVQSQTFDQAETQSRVGGRFKPQTVSVWVITPLRFVISGEEQKIVRQLRERCPGVSIKLIPEINRLGNFPSNWFLRFNRSLLRGFNTLFHFRGESAFQRFNSQYRVRQQDRTVLDVRGYWPAEYLYEKGIESENDVPKDLQASYNHAVKVLVAALQKANGIITVSKNLEQLIRALSSRTIEINVVPCCVGKIHDRKSREGMRKLLGIASNEKLLVYSGGYARYQHLEDLTIPFLKLLLTLSSQVKVLILSQDVNKIKGIVETIVSADRFIFKTATQSEVAGYLAACDLGFLLRKETLVNRLAQPVKVGEYLAAGVPVCVEGEVGGVTEKLIEYHAGVSIKISGTLPDAWQEQAQSVLDFLKQERSMEAQTLAKNYFLWDNIILRQREYYSNIFAIQLTKT